MFIDPLIAYKSLLFIIKYTTNESLKRYSIKVAMNVPKKFWSLQP